MRIDSKTETGNTFKEMLCWLLALKMKEWVHVARNAGAFYKLESVPETNNHTGIFIIAQHIDTILNF